MTKATLADKPARASHDPMAAVASWSAANASVFITRLDGETIASYGETERVYPLASVTKLLTTYGVAVAVNEGIISFDDPVRKITVRNRTFTLPADITVRHLLSHASGLGFELDSDPICGVGTVRSYGNADMVAAASYVASHMECSFANYVARKVFHPLGMHNTTTGRSAAAGGRSSCTDLALFAAEWANPKILPNDLVAQMTQVAYPGLSGVVPGVGKFDPCDWGLGVERNFGRLGHWAGNKVSPSAYGHFGGAGTFLFSDPQADLTCIALTDRSFDAWAMEKWPRFAGDVIQTYGAR